MELQEKKLLSSTIRFGESLKDSSAFSLNDIKQIDEDSQVHRENWDNLKDEMDWRIKRYEIFLLIYMMGRKFRCYFMYL